MVAAALALTAGTAFAVKTSTWTTDEVDEFLRGDATSVSIDSAGRLTLGLTADTLVGNLEGVTYIWSLARTSKGTLYFGTGDNGSIYRLPPGGRPAAFWETGAGEITALALDAKENLYAGSTPGGTVFRVSAGGDTTRYFETGEESVWSLHVGRDGALYVGTGSQGKIFRVTGSGRGTLFAETRDVNVLSLAETRDGAILAGTAGKGLLWRIEKDGEKRVIFDSSADELRAIAVLPDGTIAVGVNRTGGGDQASGGGGGGGGSGGKKGDSNPYSVEVTPPSGGGGGGNAQCAVALVRPDGSARLLYSPPCEYLYALAPVSDSTVLAATGEPAALFQVGVDRKYALLFAPEAKQIVAAVQTPAGIFVATGNAASISRLGPGDAKSGTYLSEAKDLHSVAQWGRVIARISDGGDVLFSSRSGLGQTPDDGWSGWSKERALRDKPLIESPPARFLQYRLRFTGGGKEKPSLGSVEVSYLQENLPPEILGLSIYGPSTPFAQGPADYRPPQLSQTFPDGLKLEYSFQRSGPHQAPDASVGWARGVRSAVWEARDPNGDNLSYTVSIKAEDEKVWRPLGEPTGERGLSWDSQAFANGTYRIRVEASDEPDNPQASALKADRVSPPFQIDNVPPRIEGLSAQIDGGRRGAGGTVAVRGTAVDADSRIGRIEYSLDGGDWMQVFPIDGIFDAMQEEFRFEVKDLKPGEHTITVRASDTERNVAVGKAVAVTP
jgi:hypothetical protein